MADHFIFQVLSFYVCEKYLISHLGHLFSQFEQSLSDDAEKRSLLLINLSISTTYDLTLQNDLSVSVGRGSGNWQRHKFTHASEFKHMKSVAADTDTTA